MNSSTKSQDLFRSIIIEEFGARKATNQQYSMRAMARDLAISPSFLVNLINGKRSLSESKAKKIANSLSLTFMEKRKFLVSAKIESTRDQKAKEALRKELEILLSESNKFRKSEAKELRKINSWLHFAVLSLLELENKPMNAKKLADRFNRKEPQINEVIKDLLEFQYIESIDGIHFKTKVSSTETTTQKPSTDIRKIHRSSLEKSIESIDDNFKTRELSTAVLSFASADYSDAKEMINDFVYQFHSRFSESSSKDSIRQLSIQFVRLDKGRSCDDQDV